MLTLNVILFVLLLMLDAGNMQIAFPETEEIQLPSPRDAELYLGLKTLVNLKEENAVVSPANIYSCLWLLYSGARGDTKTELRNALGTKDGFLMQQLSGVYTANAMFLTPSVTVKNAYLLSVNQSIFSVNFEEGEATREIINGWVDKETRGTIPAFLDAALDSSSVAVVISALYFNASWLNIFDESSTKLGDFETSSAIVQVPLMTVNALLPVVHSSSFRAVGLPYQNKDFTFYIILPNSSGGRALKNMIRHLTPEAINKMVDSMREENLVVTVPKFVLNQRAELRPILQGLGINKIFDPVNADFGDLFDATNGTRMFVSEIFQTVHLKVDEGGTEGAAATGAVLTKSGRSVFRATRPFIFLLRHTSGRVLFLGTLTNPKL